MARKLIAGIAAAAASIAALVACGSDPDAEPAAEALAAALQSGDFAAVPLADADAVADAFGEITAGMGESPLAASVAGITETDEGRDITFDLAWDVGLEYSTSAAMTLVEDEWLVEWAPSVVHPDLAGGDRLRLRTEQAQRADIRGAGGDVLVTDRPVRRIGIDKTQVTGSEAVAAARELADTVGVDADSFADRVQGAGDRAFVEAITLREDDAEDVLDEVDDIAGGLAIGDSLPLAPTREFARPIVGSVGEATAEVIEESEGRISAGDQVGLSGLQQQYDEQLAGTAGVTVEIVPAKGDAVVVFERAPEPGTSLTATLDPDLQQHAEDVLADTEPASAIVAVQPSTGAVLAAASGPGGQGYPTATLGQYAPGSTFKIVTALALIRRGLSADTVLTCQPTIDVDGYTFKNYDDYPAHGLGDIPLRLVVAHSCNTALIDQRETVSQADLADAAAALGIGVDGSIGAPAFLGDVPTEAGGTEHAASMIGQGTVLASPLAMAGAAASVAAGHTVVPHLVDGVQQSADGSLTTDEAAVLREFMYAVVDDGSAQFLDDLPGEDVGAKTGTAEFATEDGLETHAWMIAIQGDLAVTVFVEEGDGGSQTAGPLLESFLS